MLDLKANPDKKGSGTVVEASLDKGRGFMCTALVQSGTLKVGDYVLLSSSSRRSLPAHKNSRRSLAPKYRDVKKV